MRIHWLCSVLMLSAAAASAQTTGSPAPSVASVAPKTISVTGCVANGSKSDAVTLTNAMVLPFGSPAVSPEPISAADAVASATPEPPPVSPAPTQPQASAPPEPRARASAIPGAVGTSGTIAGTAPAGSSASTMDGYHLAGVDMTSWIGRRVQILGTVEPAKEAVVLDTTKPPAPAMPTLRVLSVQPVTGPCVK
jgi:hypothetical protein